MKNTTVRVRKKGSAAAAAKQSRKTSDRHPAKPVSTTTANKLAAPAGRHPGVDVRVVKTAELQVEGATARAMAGKGDSLPSGGVPTLGFLFSDMEHPVCRVVALLRLFSHQFAERIERREGDAMRDSVAVGCSVMAEDSAAALYAHWKATLEAMRALPGTASEAEAALAKLEYSVGHALMMLRLLCDELSGGEDEEMQFPDGVCGFGALLWPCIDSLKATYTAAAAAFDARYPVQRPAAGATARAMARSAGKGDSLSENKNPSVGTPTLGMEHPVCRVVALLRLFSHQFTERIERREGDAMRDSVALGCRVMAEDSAAALYADWKATHEAMRALPGTATEAEAALSTLPKLEYSVGHALMMLRLLCDELSGGEDEEMQFPDGVCGFGALLWPCIDSLKATYTAAAAAFDAR